VLKYIDKQPLLSAHTECSPMHKGMRNDKILKFISSMYFGK